MGWKSGPTGKQKQATGKLQDSSSDHKLAALPGMSQQSKKQNKSLPRKSTPPPKPQKVHALDLTWNDIQAAFANCSSYKEMEEFAKSVKPCMEIIHINHTICSTKGSVDQIALKNYLDDAPGNLLPVNVYGDGNCLP